MKTPFQLSIAKPCHENWADFSATPSGGFCGSCQKDVVDFSKMSKNQLVDFFKNLPSTNTRVRVCGRFEKKQLEPVYNVQSWFKDWSADDEEYVYELPLNQVKKEPHRFLLYDFNKISRKAAVIALMIISIESGFGQSQKIKGKIVDSSDDSPIAGVYVSVKGKPYSTKSEADGTYKLKVDRNDILIFKTSGFEKLEKLSNQILPLTKLKPENTELESFYISVASQARRNQLDYIKGEVSVEDVKKYNEEYQKICKIRPVKMKILGSSTVNQEIIITPEIIHEEGSTSNPDELPASWYQQNAFHVIKDWGIFDYVANKILKTDYRKNDDGTIAVNLKDIPEGRYILQMIYANSQTTNRFDSSTVRFVVKR
jgi:hypothetical protein